MSIQSVAYSDTGDHVGGGCADGSIQIWDLRGSNLYRPTIYMPDAHTPGSEVTGIRFFGQNFASRAMDDSLKLWDIRMHSKPVFEWHDLVNLSAKTNISISPDGKVIITGTSVRKNYGQSMLKGYSVASGETVCEVPMGTVSAIHSYWHSALNQIFVGMADGKIQVLYDPSLSKGGVLKCISKQEKRKIAEANSTFSNSVFKSEQFKESFKKVYGTTEPEDDAIKYRPVPILEAEVYEPMRKRDKKLETKKLVKPEMPLQGPAKGGRTPQSGTLAQYVMKDLYKNVQRDMDPREALLAHAKLAKEEPLWVAPAYAKTQPKHVFMKEDLRQDNVKFLEASGKEACKHCGLKFCTCIN